MASSCPSGLAVAFLGLVGAIAGGLGAQVASPSGTVPREPFHSILWLHRGPERDAKFFAAVKAAGFTGVSVSTSQDPAVPGAHGLRYYHDQICGKGVLELRDAQFDPVRKAYLQKREGGVLVRPSCLSEPAVLAEMLGTVGRRLGKTLPHKPWAISLGDEISVTRHANPLDLCFAPATLAGFRKFLAARYLTIDRLNGVWGTDFASFARVRPFTADAIRTRELGGERWPQRLTPWADHREFMDREMARTVETTLAQVGRRAPGVPAGLTGLQQPSAYGGHDYARLLPSCTFYEVYDIGGARDLAMALAPAGAAQTVTLFGREGAVSRSMVTARYADAIAHGMAGVIVWSAGLAYQEDCQLTPFGTALSEAMRSMRREANRFAGAQLQRSPVWLVESQPSVRAWWMLDSRADGATWIKRLSSYEAGHSTSLASRHGWVRLLEDLGHQPDFVVADKLAERLGREKPRVIVLPATVAMSSKVAAALRKFVVGGGVLLADHSVGVYDERLVQRERAALDDLFALKGRSDVLEDLLLQDGKPVNRARIASGAAVVEARLRGELSDPYGSFHVQLESSPGRGRAVYLNLAMSEYGAVRLEPKRLDTALDLRRRVRSVLRTAGVLPPVYLRAKQGMPTCLERMSLRGHEGEELLAIRVNALESPAVLQKLAARGPASIELVFAEPVALEIVGSGKLLKKSLRHTLLLDPSRGLFLAVRRDR